MWNGTTDCPDDSSTDRYAGSFESSKHDHGTDGDARHHNEYVERDVEPGNVPFDTMLFAFWLIHFLFVYFFSL